MPTITRKDLDNALFASVRFWGQREDIPTHFEPLAEAVKPYAQGHMIRMIHAQHPEKGLDIEVGLPVSQPVNTGAIKTRTLIGGPMLCTLHVGPPETLSDTWGPMIAYIREHAIGIAEDPVRTVQREGPAEHGDDTAQYVTEIQVPLLLPRWIKRMAGGLDHHAGEEVRRHVLAGSDDLAFDTFPVEKTRWAQGVMQRLDAAIADETVRCDIMNRCAHIFPQDRIDHLRAEYERLGDLDALLEIMGRDRSVGGTSFYAQPYCEGNVIIETKIPANPQGYEEATDLKEKRAHACFCPLIRTAIRNDMPMSNTFCNCGGGWFRRLWEGVLGQPVRVEVLKTVLRGDDVCQFAVHLSSGTE
jgi:effector-binding domain-containing protein